MDILNAVKSYEPENDPHLIDFSRKLKAELAKASSSLSVQSLGDNEWTSLHYAALYGYVDIARSLVESGFNVNAKDSMDLATPLHFAAAHGNLEIVQLLLEHGGDPNSEDNDGCTPLVWAEGAGHNDVVTYLLAHGANPLQREIKVASENAHKLARRGAVQALAALLDADEKRPAITDKLTIMLNKQRTAFIDMPDRRDQSAPLHYAAAWGHLSAVEFLLKKGANVKIRDYTYQTPLHLASMKGHTAIAEVLLNYGARVLDVSDMRGNSPLHMAAKGGNKALVSLLVSYRAIIDNPNHDGYTPLMISVMRGNLSVTKTLLELKARTDLRNSQGRGLIHIAVINNQTHIVEYLLDRGWDVNEPDERGLTPLHDAACHSDPSLVSMLIDRGANLEADIYQWANAPMGETPLYDSLSKRRCPDNAMVLIERGANVNAISTDGYTPLHHAALKDDEPLLEALLAKGADINAATSLGHTPLHLSLDRGSMNSLLWLIDHGANVEAYALHQMGDVYSGWCTPLQRAVLRGNLNAVMALVEKANADMEVEPSPLILASEHSGHFPIVQWLVEHGADLEAQKENGQSALDVASTDEIRAYLEEAMQQVVLKRSLKNAAAVDEDD